MSDISEDNCSAAWLMDLEFYLWKALEADDRKSGWFCLTEEEVTRLRELSRLAGGWIAWGDSEPEKTFVTFQEWQERLPAYEARLGNRK